MEVQAAWNRLLMVRALEFTARSGAAESTGWAGDGRGVVTVEEAASHVILFHERGTWSAPDGRETVFTNVFRWTAAADGCSIRLEHLRFGPQQPVYLFELVPAQDGVLKSSEPHVCSEDLYAAQLTHDAQCMQLHWTIKGPKKDESIHYRYQ